MARIGLDARMIGSIPTGLGTYATELARALIRIDSVNSYVIIRGPHSAAPVPRRPLVEEVILAGDLDTPRNLAHGRFISRLGLDLYHSLHHFLPLGVRVPRVVITLHDLIWLEHSDLIIDGGLATIHRTATHLYARVAMRHALTRADRTIAISNHTRTRALGYYRLNPNHVTVVHHGVDHHAFAFAGSANNTRPYFVAVGNTRPYKNMATAVRAFAICARQNAEVELVIAGRGDSIATLRPLADQLGVGERVRFVGPLAHDQLLALLHTAKALLFPSFIEGFGLPVLEAMAAGCAVIGSRIPTVTEVVDSAALLCDPAKPAEFAEAMMTVLSDEATRRDLVRRGSERAAHFSWERCAAETLAVYRQLL